jgi:phospholipase C
MPSNCALSTSGNYAVKHNPQAYYTNVRTDCATTNTPLGSTPNISRKFTLVTPNMCNDMHDCSVSTGDTWLKGFIPKLLASSEYQAGNTAIFVTFDEAGGYWDSGFVQPIDYFGDGPRIPMIAVSRFSTGGRVSHVYNEHSSFVKFVERNWQLGTTLSERSRDNLPNPVASGRNPYVPRNMPAIGDLFDLFDFDGHGRQ